MGSIVALTIWMRDLESPRRKDGTPGLLPSMDMVYLFIFIWPSPPPVLWPSDEVRGHLPESPCECLDIDPVRERPGQSVHRWHVHDFREEFLGHVETVLAESLDFKPGLGTGRDGQDKHGQDRRQTVL